MSGVALSSKARAYIRIYVEHSLMTLEGIEEVLRKTKAAGAGPDAVVRYASDIGSIIVEWEL